MAAFLAGRIGFNDIVPTIEETLAASNSADLGTGTAGLGRMSGGLESGSKDLDSGIRGIGSGSEGLDSTGKDEGSGRQTIGSGTKLSIEDVLAADEWARRQARTYTSG